MRTVTELLDRCRSQFADLPALRCPERREEWTWAETWERSRSVALRLIAAGMRPGDRVLLLAPNEPLFAAGLFGAALARCVAVPVNARLTAAEVRGILRHCGSRAALATPALAGVLGEATAGMQTAVFDLEAMAGPRPPGGEIPIAEPDDDAQILYTSGTTGRPKGVVLSQAACVAAASMAVTEFAFRPLERVLVVMPLSHSAPLNLCLLGCVRAGSTAVLGTFDPRRPEGMLDTIQAERTNVLFAAPVAYLLALQAEPAARDLSSMRLWIYGGASMAAPQVALVQQAFGGNWMGVYGLTEAGPDGMALSPTEHAKAGSLGRFPTVNAELRLVDAHGRDAAAGEPGEILLRTPSAMRGYLDDPEATQEVLRDGWIHTGDMAQRDADGYYWLLDRKKDLILSGGYNVFPKEVEDAIARHPSVAATAVFGSPHPEWGETVTAAVVLRPGSSLHLGELRTFLDPIVSRQKQPRRLVVVEDLPRSPTGKVLRHVLRDRFASEDEGERA